MLRGFGPAVTSRDRSSLAAGMGQRVGQQNPHVGVCALILALGRFGIASKDQPRALERRGQNTASNTGWTSKKKSPRGSREPAHIDTIAAEVGPCPNSADVQSRWTAEA